MKRNLCVMLVLLFGVYVNFTGFAAEKQEKVEEVKGVTLKELKIKLNVNSIAIDGLKSGIEALEIDLGNAKKGSEQYAKTEMQLLDFRKKLAIHKKIEIDLLRLIKEFEPAEKMKNESPRKVKPQKELDYIPMPAPGCLVA